MKRGFTPVLALAAFHADRAQRNFARMRILLGLMVPVHAAHATVFAIVRPGTDAVWRGEIILAHTVMAAIGAAVLVPMWHPRTRDAAWVVRGLPLGLGVYYMLVGAVVSAIDQRVTASAYPFIEATIGLGLALRLSRQQIAVAFALDFATFAVAISLAQHDSALRTSLLVNGLTVAAVGAGLSLGFGAAHARDFVQRQTIEAQAKELVDANARLRASLDALRVVNADLATEIEHRRVAQEELAVHASTDALTGLMNRRHFLESAEREVARAAAERVPLVLAMLDADHFKAINDSYGHEVGDDALRLIADCARCVLRRGDIVGRLGGEEFGILMIGADLEGAGPIIERIRTSTATRSLETRDGSAKLSVSVGYTAVDPHEPDALKEALRRADQALYSAKRAGRNRVFSEPPRRGSSFVA